MSRIIKVDVGVAETLITLDIKKKQILLFYYTLNERKMEVTFLILHSQQATQSVRP